ncbi:hypothetical protein EW146_g5149 [Bondarzewia mesenterica]|uniref:Uncharacterized protein n=1 Tax=Bondarzewia mesenterica TaxID=1095465 RepID=A0A4S4LSD7_9AGAM|nr:hypothetical protein EW146_g5149 [Bondarzewia mesenterica]
MTTAQPYFPKDESFVMPSESTHSVNLAASKFSPTGDWLIITQANTLLDADFTTCKARDMSVISARTLAHSVPSGLTEHISFMHPTIARVVPFIHIPHAIITPFKIKILNHQNSSPFCQDFVTPKCLEDLYGVLRASVTQSSNRLGVSVFGGDFASESDLNACFEFARLSNNFDGISRPRLPFTVISVNGGTNQRATAVFRYLPHPPKGKFLRKTLTELHSVTSLRGTTSAHSESAFYRSAGGFSYCSLRPLYQDVAVTA